MDSYSGSEPRKFISFHLGKEKNSQCEQAFASTEMATDPVQSDVRETHEITPTVQPTEQTELIDQGSPPLQLPPSQSLISRFFVMRTAARTLRAR